jgi:hypothetical protein
MIDKEKIEEGVNEYYPYLDGKDMIHPINYQRAKQRDAFLTGVEWALKQVKNNGVSDDVSQQRELLKVFLEWQQNKYSMPYDTKIEWQIKDFEAFNCG